MEKCVTVVLREGNYFVVVVVWFLVFLLLFGLHVFSLLALRGIRCWVSCMQSRDSGHVVAECFEFREEKGFQRLGTSVKRRPPVVVVAAVVEDLRHVTHELSQLRVPVLIQLDFDLLQVCVIWVTRARKGMRIGTRQQTTGVTG